MSFKSGQNNTIDDTAQISPDVVIGSYNWIGKNVVISGFKGQTQGEIRIGDCNYIHDNTRILMGPQGLYIGDWNVFHNNMLVMGQERMEIGHNCWFGQHTILDSAGGLFIGNGVRVGMYSQIWTHVASGELVEGCALIAFRPTHIEDEVWLVGSCIVGSGLRLGRRSICLIGSILTKDTNPGKTYGGAPAKQLERLNLWREVSFDDKIRMMVEWARDFADQSKEDIDIVYQPTNNPSSFQIISRERQEKLIIGIDVTADITDRSITYFDLRSKTYTKRLSVLERQFYRYIYDHKARFIPCTDIT